MAQAAVDIPLWGIIAKAAQQPLWQLLGGGRAADIPVYNTNAGWLNLSIAQLQDEALRLLDQGYSAPKMKVGLADVNEDYRRMSAVRRASPRPGPGRTCAPRATAQRAGRGPPLPRA